MPTGGFVAGASGIGDGNGNSWYEQGRSLGTAGEAVEAEASCQLNPRECSQS